MRSGLKIPQVSLPYAFTLVGIAAALCGAIYPALTALERDGHAAGTPRFCVPLIPIIASPSMPQLIDLGSVACGGSAEARFDVINSGDSPIEIVRVETSCGCVSVKLLERTIAPHRSVAAIMRLNLSNDPDFEGGLCPEIRLFDNAGRVAFTFVAKVVAAGELPAPPPQRGKFSNRQCGSNNGHSPITLAISRSHATN